jgi:hypothetical protein
MGSRHPREEETFAVGMKCPMIGFAKLKVRLDFEGPAPPGIALRRLSFCSPFNNAVIVGPDDLGAVLGHPAGWPGLGPFARPGIR